MVLQKLSLVSFRNFTDKKLTIDPGLTLILGKNSQGKTNLLEAIFFVFNGVGFRETKEEELLLFGQKNSYVEGEVVEQDGESFRYSVKVTLNDGRVNKKFFVNRTEKNHSQYLANQARTVLFSPEQINIIAGAPQLRRDYFNKLISTYDLEYKKRLVNYESALRKRNKILELRYPLDKLREELEFWNDYLIKQGSYLTEKRQAYVDFLNKNQKLDSKKFSIRYLRSEITEDALRNSLEKEIKVRKTLVGPQKDDFQIFIDSSNNKNVQVFGSRSEQRLAIFWLKLNEILYSESFFKKKPVILLDDIFSELDENNQKIIFPLIGSYQIVATTTEKRLVDLIKMKKTVIVL
ncbi:DNA replication and repair protein RecF [Patescibacteria group bacterium]|nr:DNA replication and repair protein RecF [Patescibacteria group bacterium]